MTVSIEPSRIRDSSPARSIEDVGSAGAGTRVLLVSGSILLELRHRNGQRVRPRRPGKMCVKVVRG
jgi:hypothetical protein